MRVIIRGKDIVLDKAGLFRYYAFRFAEGKKRGGGFSRNDGGWSGNSSTKEANPETEFEIEVPGPVIDELGMEVCP